MISPVVQRWRANRASYRPAGEPIVPRDLPGEMSDRALCASHASHVGKDVDYCPAHATLDSKGGE